MHVFAVRIDRLLILATCALAWWLVVTLPAQASAHFDQDFVLKLGGRYGRLEQRRLSVVGTGTVTSTPTEREQFYKTVNFYGDFRVTNDIRDNMILDLRSRWNIDWYDPSEINFGRFLSVTGNTELELAYAPRDDKLWALSFRHGKDRLELYPEMDNQSFEGELAFDRQVGKHVFLTFRTGAKRTKFADDSEWDHDDVYICARYQNLVPERYDIDALPAHPRRYKPDRDKVFELSDTLDLVSSRRAIRRFRAAELILDNIPPLAAPPTEDLRVDVKLGESFFSGGLGLTYRKYPNLGDQEGVRTDADAMVRWFLGNNLELTLQDRFAWQDYNIADYDRWLLDHGENDFLVYVTHSRKRQHLKLEAGFKSFFFDKANERDYNKGRLAAAWDYHDNHKYSYSVRASYSRMIPDDKGADNEEIRQYNYLGAFRIHFTNERTFIVSFARERETVHNGIQSEFESSYARNTFEMKYRHQLASELALETGYLFERERHEIFYENNRDEEIGFLNLVLCM